MPTTKQNNNRKINNNQKKHNTKLHITSKKLKKGNHISKKKKNKNNRKHISKRSKKYIIGGGEGDTNILTFCYNWKCFSTDIGQFHPVFGSLIKKLNRIQKTNNFIDTMEELDNNIKQRIYNYNIGNDEVDIIYPEQKIITSLHIYFDDKNLATDHDIAAIAKVLKDNNTINTLILSILKKDNLNIDNINKIATALQDNKYTALKHINLNDNNIGIFGAIAISDALLNNKKLKNQLQVLSLASNNIENEGATALANALIYYTKLTHINLDTNNIGFKGIKSLVYSLLSNEILHNSLESFSLNKNNIGNDGVKEFVKLLSAYKKIKTINLNGNNIGDEGAIAIANSYNKDTLNIKNIYLNHNNIGDSGTNALLLKFKEIYDDNEKNKIENLKLNFNYISSKFITDNKLTNNVEYIKYFDYQQQKKGETTV